MNSAASRATSIKNSDYCCSKFALRAYTTTLRLELEEKKSPVSMTNIYPTVINTGLFRGVQPGLAFLSPILDEVYVA